MKNLKLKFPLVTLAVMLATSSNFAIYTSAYAALPSTPATIIDTINQPNVVPPSGPANKDNVRINVESAKENASGLSDVEGLKVTISGFTVSGLDGIADLQIDVKSLLSKYEGVDKTFQDIKDATVTLKNALQQQGLVLAQVYIPPQKLGGGVVELAVLPGRLDKIIVNYDKEVTVKHDVVEGIAHKLQSGSIIRIAEIERVLFLLSDMYGVKVKSVLKPGKLLGSVDLELNVAQTRFVDGSINADNSGTTTIGIYRFGGAVNLNSPSGRGDQLSFSGMMSDTSGLNFGRLSYLMPVGYDGLKIGVAASALQYTLRSATLDPLAPNGKASTGSVFGMYPMIRSRNRNLFIQAGIDTKSYSDNFAGLKVSNNKLVRMTTVGVVADSSDSYAGGGMNAYNLSYSVGQLNLDSNLLSVDTLGTAGSFSKFGYGWSRLQTLPFDKLVLYASINGQFANKNLDVSEKMSLGGVDGVRAYVSGESSSDEAYLARLELRKGIPTNGFGDAVTSFFYDYGHGTINKTPFIATGLAQAQNAYSLKAVGVGLNWVEKSGYSLKSSLAWRISPAGTADVDKVPRLFIQGAKRF